MLATGLYLYELLLTLSLLALVVVIVHAFLRPGSHRLPLPPSPSSEPIIGHLRSLPVENAHIAYAKLGRELKSDIISLTVLGQTIVVLNSAEVAHELLDQRSAIYSDRPELPMVSKPELLDCRKLTSLVRYGDRWRSQRRMTHSALHRTASVQFWPMTLRQARLAMLRIVDDPNNFSTEFRRMSGTTMLSSVYGYEVTSAHDPLVEAVELAVSHMCEAAVPGNFYVNTTPWLRFAPDWFPGTDWKQKVKQWRSELVQMVDTPFNWAESQISQGAPVPSVVKTLLAELENQTMKSADQEEEIDMIKWTAGTLFAAGADTTVAAILIFVLAMTLYPDVQARAQAEIDQVVGKDRLPEIEDRDSMPYLECVLKEVLRWQSVTPLGVAHVCMKEDEYAGYRIPEGAIVIGNVWAISNNSSTYPNPERFDPDRFLDPSTPNAPAFGFGRRSCPGLHMAQTTLFITMCSLLAVFKISPVRDDQGNELPPPIEMKSNAIISYPGEFKCSIKPRSRKAVELLNASV